jgi:hypothetical protein
MPGHDDRPYSCSLTDSARCALRVSSALVLHDPPRSAERLNENFRSHRSRSDAADMRASAIVGSQPSLSRLGTVQRKGQHFAAVKPLANDQSTT